MCRVMGQENAHVGGDSDSRIARRSGGSSISLKPCCSWLAEKGISISYCDAMAACCSYGLCQSSC